MRAGLSTIQQTLTPESSSILTQSIAEAARRNHGQTTPLHVAAALLSSPSGLLRQACISSHPTSSHPLQCRALELCFSVALDRLPSVLSNSDTTTSNTNNNNNNNNNNQPPISNALMAALKRAQAHQRRGCPETQQSPLLAVKVELEQLVISILDDPSVSRVMKEASFSSPDVKASIEHSLSLSASPPPSTNTSSSSSSSVYMNPLLGAIAKQQQLQHEFDCSEARKVVEILKRPKKRNPILVGDSDLNSLMKEVMDKFGVNRVVSLERELKGVDRGEIPRRIREVGEGVLKGGEAEVLVDLGDLKWMVESGGEIGKEVVVEMGKVLGRSGGRIWGVGRATCATYLRCQVYFPAMDKEWDVQAVPVAPRAAPPGLLFASRLGSSNGILSSSVEALAPPKGFPPTKPITIPPLRRPPETTTTSSSDALPKQTALCPQCSEGYEHELAKLVAKEFNKGSSNSKPEVRTALPQWLQMATPIPTKAAEDKFKSKDHELSCKQSMEELNKRWHRMCSRLHSNTFNPRSFHPKLMNPSLPQGFPSFPMAHSSGRAQLGPTSPPRSPVKTDLVLGNPKPQDKLSGQRNGGGGLKSFEDPDSLKKLFKGLLEKVSWQAEAASAVTATILQSKSGNGKRRAGAVPRADTWLLFIGHDRIGKRKMASALSELMFGVEPVSVRMGPGDNDGETTNVSFRGKTPIDRVAEAVRRNPFSVIVLEDVDRVDTVVGGTIRRAIERGRLADSYGREVSLGSSIFVMTACWLPNELKCSTNSLLVEERILSSAQSGWKFEVSVGTGKRLPDWMTKDDGNQSAKRKKDTSLSLDLNLGTGGGGGQDDEAFEGSGNSSELTVEHESNEYSRLAIKQWSSSSMVSEYIELVDDSVVFKPVDFGTLRKRVSECISSKFAAIMGNGRSIRIDDNVVDGIVGSIWMSSVGVDEWAEKTLVPSIEELRRDSTVGDGNIVRLLAVDGGRQQPDSRVGLAGDWLPSAVTMAGI